MFGKTIRLFTVFGFTVKLDLSWLVIMGLVIWSLTTAVFPARYPGYASGVYLAMGLAGALGLFLAIVIHELSHSLVARRFGLPMKGITLFLFGGVAEMSDEPPSAKAEGLMAAAGPGISLVLAGVLLGLAELGVAWGWQELLVGVLRWTGMLNLILAAFNLIPGFPMDGGRILRAILWHRRGSLTSATRTASKVGSGFGLVLMGLGVLAGVGGDLVGGIWLVLIGIFIRNAARQALRQVTMRQAFRGERVRQFMNPDPVAVPAATSVDRFVDDYLYRYPHQLFPVVRDGDRLAGSVNLARVQSLPREQWRSHTVDDLTEGCSPATCIEADADALEALARMSQQRSEQLLVVEDHHLVGTLTLHDLLRLASLKQRLQDDPART